MSQRRRVHLLISGRVQGVFFRVRCQAQAEGLALSGWVRNLTDGRVEVQAEGPLKATEAFIAWCRQGPAGGRVDEVLLRDEPPTGDRVGFRIERDG